MFRDRDVHNEQGPKAYSVSAQATVADRTWEVDAPTERVIGRANVLLSES